MPPLIRLSQSKLAFRRLDLVTVIVKQGDADAVLAKAGGALVAELHQFREPVGCLRVSRFTSAITALPTFSPRQPELKPKLKSRVTRSFSALSAKMMRVKVLAQLRLRLR